MAKIKENTICKITLDAVDITKIVLSSVHNYLLLKLSYTKYTKQKNTFHKKNIRYYHDVFLTSNPIYY